MGITDEDLEKLLNTRLKSQLVIDAAKLGFEGYDKKTKSELVRLLLEKPKELKKYLYPPWYLKYRPQILIALGCGLFFFILNMCYSNSNTSNVDLKSNNNYNVNEAFVGLDSVLEILILPLFPDKDCRIEHTNYEIKILEHIKELTIDKNDVNVKLIDSIYCPRSVSDAIETANNHNADLVIWGKYIEECDGLPIVSINYAVLESSFYIPDTIIGHYKQLTSLVDFENGGILLETDNIIRLVGAILSVRNKEYNQAIAYLNDRSTFENCDLWIFYLYLSTYIEFLSKDELIETIKTSAACDTSMSSKFLMADNILLNFTDANKSDVMELYNNAIHFDSTNFRSHLYKVKLLFNDLSF